MKKKRNQHQFFVVKGSEYPVGWETRDYPDLNPRKRDTRAIWDEAVFRGNPVRACNKLLVALLRGETYREEFQFKLKIPRREKAGQT